MRPRLHPPRLRLDYQPPPWHSYRAGMALLLVAIAVSVALLGGYIAINAEIESQEIQWQGLERGVKRSHNETRNGAVAEQLQPELKRANEIVNRLALPWDELFKAVEASASDQVALLSIEPDTAKRTLAITAEAKDFAGMLDYVKRLGAEPVLADAHIVSHQIQQQDPQKPVRFTVHASWGGN